MAPHSFARGLRAGGLIGSCTLSNADPDGEVLAYCKIGKSSYMATRVLAEYGIPARSLTGGYYRYESAAADGTEN
jgi:rhodanese-related sulfurtransferase